MVNTKKSSFYRFLIKQKNRDNPIGDLAIDVGLDKKFPAMTDSLEKIKDYLICNFASSEAIQSLDEAFKEFKKNKNNRSTISVSIRFEVFRRDKYRCQICGAKAKDDNVRLEVDHKTPIALGGGNEMSNLWTLCFDCNRGKGIKNL